MLSYSNDEKMKWNQWKAVIQNYSCSCNYCFHCVGNIWMICCWHCCLCLGMLLALTSERHPVVLFLKLYFYKLNMNNLAPLTIHQLAGYKHVHSNAIQCNSPLSLWRFSLAWSHYLGRYSCAFFCHRRQNIHSEKFWGQQKVIIMVTKVTFIARELYWFALYCLCKNDTVSYQNEVEDRLFILERPQFHPNT